MSLPPREGIRAPSSRGGVPTKQKTFLPPAAQKTNNQSDFPPCETEFSDAPLRRQVVEPHTWPPHWRPDMGYNRRAASIGTSIGTTIETTTGSAAPIETTIGTPIGTTAKRTIETTIGTAIGTTIRTIACGRRQTDTRAAGATDNRFSWQAQNNHQTTTSRAIRLLSTERWKRSSEQPERRRRRFFICTIKATTRRATGGGQPVGESFVLPDPQQRGGQPSNRGHRATGRATADQPRTLATAG